MEICDGCASLEIEEPVNRYDVWRACCCDPDKPAAGARRVVDTAPAGSASGPFGITRPAWCRGRRIATAVCALPRNDRSGQTKESRHGGGNTVTVIDEI